MCKGVKRTFVRSGPLDRLLPGSDAALVSSAFLCPTTAVSPESPPFADFEHKLSTPPISKREIGATLGSRVTVANCPGLVRSGNSALAGRRSAEQLVDVESREF